MKTSPQISQLIYEPTREIGIETFEGLPCPTQDAFEYLDATGVAYIKQRLNEMLSWRKEMFGAKELEYYGFSPIQYFTDIQNEIVFAVGGTIDRRIFTEKHLAKTFKKPIEIPKLVIPDHFTENNFEKLHKTNHFLIEAFSDYPYHHPNISIPDFYKNHFPSSQ